jgi:hypothetical protein
MRQHVVRDPGALVADAELGVVAASEAVRLLGQQGPPPQTEAQAAAFRHRVAGVQRQVHGELLEVGTRHLDHRRIRLEVELERDGVAHQALENLALCRQSRGHVDRRLDQQLLATERQELSRQLCSGV